MSSRQRSDDRRQMTEGNYKVSGVRKNRAEDRGPRFQIADFEFWIDKEEQKTEALEFGMRNVEFWKTDVRGQRSEGRR